MGFLIACFLMGQTKNPLRVHNVLSTINHSTNAELSYHEQLPLSCALQSPVTFLICRRQLSSLILQLLQFLKLWHTVETKRDNSVTQKVLN